MKDGNPQMDRIRGVWKGAFFWNLEEAQTRGTGDVHPGFWLDKGRIAEDSARALPQGKEKCHFLS